MASAKLEMYVLRLGGCACELADRCQSLTRDLSTMPEIDDHSMLALKELGSRSLAMLDAIMSPEWEYRYFSFNANWDASLGERMASMRNGSGDEYFAICWRRRNSEGIRSRISNEPLERFAKGRLARRARPRSRRILWVLGRTCLSTLKRPIGAHFVWTPIMKRPTATWRSPAGRSAWRCGIRLHCFRKALKLDPDLRMRVTENQRCPQTRGEAEE